MMAPQGSLGNRSVLEFRIVYGQGQCVHCIILHNFIMTAMVNRTFLALPLVASLYVLACTEMTAVLPRLRWRRTAAEP